MARQFAVTLPNNMAEAVESKVRSGEYASASEVICDSLKALLEHDLYIERRLRKEAAAAYQEYLDDPSTAVPADQVLDRIAAVRAARKSD